MPTSKRPRKKGRHGKRNKLIGTLINKARATPSDISKEYGDCAQEFCKDTFELTKLDMLLRLTDPSTVQTAHIKEQFALERLGTTSNFKDFEYVGGSLAIAALLTKRLNLEESCAKEYMQELSFGCFMCSTVARLRDLGEPVPVSNLDSIRAGLSVAQDLIEYANVNDRQALIDCIYQNRKASRGKAAEERDKFVLGKYWETVNSWMQQGEAHG